MFGTIRKHQTWLWVIVITGTVICFVLNYSPANRGTGSGRASSVYYGSINGERISEQDFNNTRKEVELEYYFKSGGSWLNNEAEAKKQGFDPDRETYIRLFLNQKQEQLGVRVTSELAGQFATDMLHQFGSPAAFVEKVLQPRGLQMADLDRFFRHDLGVGELVSTIGMSGKLVTPQEAQSLYEREHQELSTEVVFFDASNYLAAISAPAEAIHQFFTNHEAEYVIPERVQVSYVKFGYSNLMVKAEQEMTNLTEYVDAQMAQIGTNYLRFAKTPEEAKAKIREDLLMKRVRPEAQRAAIAFAGPLFEPKNPPTIEEVGKTKSLTVNVTPPFDIATGPTNLDVGPEFTRAAFALSAENPVTEPIVSRDGVYVISFKNRLPREIPTLEKIHDQVVADYKYSQALIVARKAGPEFERTVTNSLAQGKTFAAAAAQANLKAVALPPFSISTRSLPEAEEHIPLNGTPARMGLPPQPGLKEIAFSTPPGKASRFYPTGEGGIMVYVKEKLPLDEAKMKSELPAYISSVRQTRSREAFDAWFRKEAEKGLRDIPYFQRQQAPTGAKS